MNRKIVLIALALLLAAVSIAADFPYLNIERSEQWTKATDSLGDSTKYTDTIGPFKIGGIDVLSYRIRVTTAAASVAGSGADDSIATRVFRKKCGEWTGIDSQFQASIGDTLKKTFAVTPDTTLGSEIMIVIYLMDTISDTTATCAWDVYYELYGDD